MKAVDFVLETRSHFLLVEFKDPDNPLTRAPERDKFISKVKSGGLDQDLTQKFRDSWLYLRASNGPPSKPIRYFVLIACSSLTSAELTVRTGELRKRLPLVGKDDQDWNWFVEDCAVFNLESWNRVFPQLALERL